MVYTLYMEIEIAKAYLHRYIEQGISLDNAMSQLSLTEEDAIEIKKDKEFIGDLGDLSNDLTLNRIEKYNSVVENEGTPGDHLKRLTATVPTIFSENAPLEISGELVIRKVREEISSGK